MPSDDDMGNSEVGHNAIGAGQVYSQGAALVADAIATGAIWQGEAWQQVVAGAKAGIDDDDFARVLEGPDAAYVTPAARQRLIDLLTTGEHAASFGEAADGILAPLLITDDPAAESFAKVTCFDLLVPAARLATELAPEIGVVPSSIGSLGDKAGEFFLAEVNKSVGIAVVERHFGLDRADIVAIGDSHNDLEMVAYAGTGVAIEGGVPELLALADLVVPTPEQAGLVVAFERLGLIDSPVCAA